jgi:hypothetical protein
MALDGIPGEARAVLGSNRQHVLPSPAYACVLMQLICC